MINISDDDIVFLKEPHQYVVRGKTIPSATQVIEAAGLGEDFSLVPPRILELARQRGDAVHLACAYLDAGELDWGTVDPRIMGYVEAYVAFRKALPVKTVVVEKRMAASLGGILLAGTPDLVGFINGRRSVVDLKTGQNADAGLQTAGYKTLWDAAHPSQPIYDRYALRLRKDGTYKLIAEENPDHIPMFLDALEYAAAKKKMERWMQKYK